MEQLFIGQVGQIMRRSVISVLPETDIQDVADELLKKHIHAVPVVDGENKVRGIVTESDFFIREKTMLHLPSLAKLLKKLAVSPSMGDGERKAIEKIMKAKAEDIMTAPCVTVREDTTFGELLTLFSEKRLKTVPVVDADQKLVGIVALVDLLSIFSGESRRNSADDESNSDLGRAVETSYGAFGKSLFMVGRKNVRFLIAISIIFFIAGVLAIMLWNAASFM